VNCSNTRTFGLNEALGFLIVVAYLAIISEVNLSAREVIMQEAMNVISRKAAIEWNRAWEWVKQLAVRGGSYVIFATIVALEQDINSL
jgi:hypothetical protein